MNFKGQKRWMIPQPSIDRGLEDLGPFYTGGSRLWLFRITMVARFLDERVEKFMDSMD